MPNYNFEDINTGELIEVSLKISEKETFLKEYPQYKQVHLAAPGVTKGTGDRTKTPEGFKEVLSKISEANPYSALASDYGHKDHQSVKKREVIKKHFPNLGGG